MSYAARENSRIKGAPCNLYMIRYGSAASSYFAYTDAEQPIVRAGITYIPVAISRGKITATGTMDKTAMELRCDENLPISEQFRVYPPTSVVNVIIYQGHVNDTEFLVGWAGRVLSSKRTDSDELVMTCEPLTTTMKRVGLREHMQYSCGHVLFGDRCRASKIPATISAQVMAISGSVVTLATAWDTAERVPKYLGGMIEWVNPAGDTEQRTILQIDDDLRTLTVSGFLRGFEIGDSIDVILGCNQQFEMNEDGIGLAPDTDCHFLHNNINNYGGCPFIPKKNPVGRLNQFY